MIKAFKIIGYIFLLCIIFFMMRFLHSYEFFVLFVILLIVPIVVELMFFLLYKRLRLNIDSKAKSITRGNSLDVVINIKSPVILSRLTFDFSVSSKLYGDYKTQFYLPVAAFFNKKTVIPFHFINGGKYIIKVDNIAARDAFGIFSVKLNIKKSFNIIVMPQIIDSGEAALGNAEMDINWAINSYNSDSGDVSGVREYIQGDRLNTIHWKASAKTDDLFVKSYEKTGSEEYIVLFDFLKDHLADSLDILYSVGNGILSLNKGFYLMWISAGAEELSVKLITNKEEFDKAIELIYNSYPIHEKGLTLHTFRKAFGISNAIYIGENRELI